MPQDGKVFQEWYCGECRTYIRFRLSVEYDRVVEVVCPMCNHHHKRYIQDGVVKDEGRNTHGGIVEQLCPLKSACSKEPITKNLQKNGYTRDGVVIKSSEDLARDAYFRERWLEIGGE